MIIVHIEEAEYIFCQQNKLIVTFYLAPSCCLLIALVYVYGCLNRLGKQFKKSQDLQGKLRRHHLSDRGLTITEAAEIAQDREAQRKKLIFKTHYDLR